jgi:hypothetical protein
MNRRNQSPRDSTAGTNWGTAFRAQAIRAIPDIPVVSVGFVNGSGRMKALRAPHWLSRFVTCPAAGTELADPARRTTDGRNTSLTGRTICPRTVSR